LIDKNNFSFSNYSVYLRYRLKGIYTGSSTSFLFAQFYSVENDTLTYIGNQVFEGPYFANYNKYAEQQINIPSGATHFCLGISTNGAGTQFNFWYDIVEKK
jgi:hypothetical protein